MRKAFTLIEMVVALGILVLVLSFAGVIFQVSIDSHRMALANAEIMQKLRVITEQLEADLSGLNKDGEIFIIWDAERKRNYTGANLNDPAAFERFDRIMFFATGDFQTYGANPVIHEARETHPGSDAAHSRPARRPGRYARHQLVQ